MNDNTLLMLAGAKKFIPNQTIGIPGQLGFGGSPYGGNSEDLSVIGLSPMPNNANPTSENYGSYRHTNGSVMLFIPAFCYRIGNPSAPSYSRDGENALEIRDAYFGEGNGWILHRAFIDGGERKLGFFMDKYLCSKDSTGNLAISVKGGRSISLATNYVSSASMPDCLGKHLDAITLGRARGAAYSCASAFMYSAIAMLSLAHGQAAKDTSSCAWFDPRYQTNFPKGNNNSLRDIDDSSVTFSIDSSNYGSVALTGSANNIAKTTHTGQLWGITDINGNKRQPMLGIMQRDGFRVAKEAIKMHDYTKDNWDDFALLDDPVPGCGLGSFRAFGNGTNCVFYKDIAGPNRALCGVIPTPSGYTTSGTVLFGNDYGQLTDHYARVICTSSDYRDGRSAGIWARIGGSAYWNDSYIFSGFRVGGYAK